MPFDFTRQAPSPETPGQVVGSGFGQEPMQAKQQLAGAIRNTANVANQILHDHVQREKQDEIDVDVTAVRAQASLLSKSLAIDISSATSVDEAKEAARNAVEEFNSWQSATDESGVPNIRWSQARKAAERSAIQFRSYADGLVAQRTAQLSRRSTVDKLEMAQNAVVRSSPTGNPGDLLGKLPPEYYSAAKAIARQKARALGLPDGDTAGIEQEILAQGQENRFLQDLGQAPPELLREISTSLKDGGESYEGLTTSRRMALAHRAERLADVKDAQAEKAHAEYVNGLRIDALTAYAGAFAEPLNQKAAEIAIGKLHDAREAGGIDKYTAKKLELALTANKLSTMQKAETLEVQQGHAQALAELRNLQVGFTAGSIRPEIARKAALRLASRLSTKDITSMLSFVKGIDKGEPGPTLSTQAFKYLHEKRMANFFGDQVYDDKGNNITAKARQEETRKLRERLEGLGHDESEKRRRKRLLSEKYAEEDRDWTLTSEILIQKLKNPVDMKGMTWEAMRKYIDDIIGESLSKKVLSDTTRSLLGQQLNDALGIK